MIKLSGVLAGIWAIALLVCSLCLSLARQEPPQPASRLFLRSQGQGMQIGRTWLDGTRRQLLSEAVGQVEPFHALSWSPDGRSIVFLDYSLQRIPAYGGEIEPLTDSYDGSPDWSPDGKWLVFSSYRENNWDIYKMRADDPTQVYRLTDNPADDITPRWSLDGEKIAFASWRRGMWDIYLMAPDGSQQTPFVQLNNDLQMADWSEEGDSFFFYRGPNWCWEKQLADGSLNDLPCYQMTTPAPLLAPALSLNFNEILMLILSLGLLTGAIFAAYLGYRFN